MSKKIVYRRQRFFRKHWVGQFGWGILYGNSLRHRQAYHCGCSRTMHGIQMHGDLFPDSQISNAVVPKFHQSRNDPLATTSHFSNFAYHCAVYSDAQSCSSLWEPMDCSLKAPLSLGFFRHECWSGLLFPPPGGLPDPGTKPESPALAGGFITSNRA